MALRARGWAVGVATVVAGVLVTGVSYGYWTSTGSGSATLRSTSAIDIEVSSVAAPLADLYPGKTDDLSFRLTNSNPYPVEVRAVTAVSLTSSDAAACPVANLTLDPAVVAGAGGVGGYQLSPPVTVPAGSTATATLPGLVTMNTSAGNGCQGKTFTVHLTLTGSQV